MLKRGGGSIINASPSDGIAAFIGLPAADPKQRSTA
jgi:hypothetical protein